MKYSLRPSGLLILLCFGPAYVSAAALQEEYCAFEVHVTSPSGKPVSRVTVSELLHNGSVFDTAITDDHGVTRLCNAPTDLIDIHVGGNLCGSVTVGNLRRYWMTTRRIPIIYSSCAGDDWLIPNSCQLTIRTIDEKGLPISGVQAIAEIKDRTPSNEFSDKFGRVFLLIPFGETTTVVLSKPRFVTERVVEACKRGEGYDKDRNVVIRAQ